MMQEELTPPQATRSPVLTRNGLACSASPLAASTGARVLAEGGNAFDAAIAVAAVETVCLSPMCGLGGEVFALLWNASEPKLYGLTGSGRAPQRATRELYQSQGYEKMPQEGPLSASIPGEVDAWATILERFGTWPLARLLEPAMSYAQEGFPLPPRIASYYPSQTPKLARFPTSRAILTRDGAPYQAGDILRQSNLARTLQRVASGGRDEFYRGETSRELVRAVQEAGGLFSEEDLEGHASILYQDPVSTTYRGHRVFITSPPSQGLIVLETLNILEGLPLAEMGWGSADAVHTMVEAKKLAFADRLKYLGDPEFVSVPVEELLSKEYAEQRRRALDPGVAAMESVAGPVGAAMDGATSYFCVADAQGNVVSFIHSLSSVMGSGFVAGDTGVLLNNRVGRGFYLEDGPNTLAPGKRTMNTIQAYMVFQGEQPWLAGGTPGGDAQPQWNTQVLTDIIDFGFSPQQAADAPRWTSHPGTDPANIDAPPSLALEPGFPESTFRELERRGHSVAHSPGAQSLGAVQLIAIDAASGIRQGACDGRTDGYAAAH